MSRNSKLYPNWWRPAMLLLVIVGVVGLLIGTGAVYQGHVAIGFADYIASVGLFALSCIMWATEGMFGYMEASEP